jgi:hypothetical protein
MKSREFNTPDKNNIGETNLLVGEKESFNFSVDTTKLPNKRHSQQQLNRFMKDMNSSNATAGELLDSSKINMLSK